MAVRGTPRNYFDAYAFLLEIDGITKAAFHTCTGLKMGGDPIKIREGGELMPHKAAGLVDAEPIELEWGETDNVELFEWFKQNFNATTGRGEANENVYKRQITIKQMNRARSVVKQWLVFDGFITNYESGDWDGEANEHHIEKVTIEHQGFDLVGAGGAIGGGGIPAVPSFPSL